MENQIARLDRDWLLEREKYKRHTEHGGEYYPAEPFKGPGQLAGTILGILFAAVGLGFVLFAVSNTSSEMSGFIVFFFMLMVVMFAAIGFTASNNGTEYHKIKNKHEEERKKLLVKLEELSNQMEADNPSQELNDPN